jgi:predicted DNA-binding ribbon-helix-helix protein
MAKRRGASVGGLITEIDAARDGGLSSAIRLFVLADLEARIS